ncbi:MAG TPA: PCRF domain-containing protein, partial [Parachlamydiaceae bacterium]|nr:PCRF domain-containing protein [Parachlamydiaceae bacterium]
MMIEQKIQKLLYRLNELEDLLAHSDVFSDQKKYRAITEEHAYLSEVKSTWDALKALEKQREDNRELLKTEKDLDFAEVLREDLADIDLRYVELEKKLEDILIPPDPNDHRNTIIEIRAGTGGDEAALFVGDCVRMYKLYADKSGWRYELISCTESEIGGFKEYVMVLSGQNVYRFLQYEGGTHRVQRVPETEAQGRVHTSAVTVAVIKEPDEDAD